MAITDKNLAKNGGTPVSTQPIIIHKPYLDEEDFKVVNETIRTTFISGNGPKCMEFEKRFSEFLGVKYVFLTNSCTTALDLAFRAKKFPQGKEVIIPNFTYTSTALGALLNGLKIKLADVYKDNGNIDISKIEERINENTVAIAPVDYAGNPVEMDEIIEIAKKHNLYIVHDAAQSIDSLYKGRKTGTLADITTFSLHGTKNMTTGEGGIIVTNNDELANNIIFMREKGTNKQSFLVDNKTRGFYEYVDIGSSYVMTNLLGGLAQTQFDKLSFITSKRTEIANYYIKNLTGIKNLEFLKNTKGAITNWHIFGILVPAEHRYWIMDALRAEGVMTNVHYTPLHRNKYYTGMATDDEMQGSMKFFERLLRLPIYPSLTNEEIELVVEATRKVITSIL